MLVVSLVLALIPLMGIVWVILSGTLTTVDGLFMSLILLTISGILLLNALMEAKARGFLKKRAKAEVAPAPTKAAAPATQPATAAPRTSEVSQPQKSG